ncbi:MAG: FAD-dependent oxidoreductase [Gammaproteobacteria bacterium]|jgi:glycine/D-amino acid oxidase-like deaminating enzyme
MNVDVIIVGQGLAGSMLAWHLLQKHVRVVVIDDHHRGSSSSVAAGLVNPITGKRLVKSWNVEQCLPAAVRFYRRLEAQWRKPLYHDKTIQRLFNSDQERDLWEQRRQQPQYQPYLGGLSESNNPFGGCSIRQSGYLNTRELLSGVKVFLKQQKLQQHDCLIEACVNYQDFTLHGQGVTWKRISAKRVIFCEGHRIRDNPWFNTLPLQPAQGEILSLKVTKPLPDHIINSGKWLLPIEPDVVKVGATFQWQPLDSVPTDKGKQELLAAYQHLWPASPAYEVIEHVCGVRPGTRDKKPFIGMHPQHSQLGVFNGFGAKGALLIPYYAERFANSLCGLTQLPEETDIARFNTYF